MGGLLVSGKRDDTNTEQSTYRNVLSHYEGRCEWLRDGNFLRDLESDSVDTEILDEELRSLDAHEPNTCQRRTEKVLESSPLQIALCVLVILDASIVVAEILLDLQATRVQSAATTNSLTLATDFIRTHFTDEHCKYDGNDVGNMIDCIDRHWNNEDDNTSAVHRSYNDDHSESISTVPPTDVDDRIDADLERTQRTPQRRRRRDDSASQRVDFRSMMSSSTDIETIEMCREVWKTQFHDVDDRSSDDETPSVVASVSSSPRKISPESSSTIVLPSPSRGAEITFESAGFKEGELSSPGRDFQDPETLAEDEVVRELGELKDNRRKRLSQERRSNYRIVNNIRRTDKFTGITGIHGITGITGDSIDRFNRQSPSSETEADKDNTRYTLEVILRHQSLSRIKRSAVEPEIQRSESISEATPISVVVSSSTLDGRLLPVASRLADMSEKKNSSSTSTPSVTSSDVNDDEGSRDAHATLSHHGGGHNEEVAALIKVAHALHYASIAILGVFVVQVVVKAIATGTHFFRQTLEVFDALVIFASFGLDVAFFDGVTDANGEHAATLILIFLLWRILRIINGLMIANKKRQDFRIKLQKRARVKLEKKLENLRDDVEWHERQAVNLKSLCVEKGASEDEMVMCRPRRHTVVQTSTMTGLSSIASLSLGLSMSMTGGGAAAASASMLRSRLLTDTSTISQGRARRASFAPLLSNGCCFGLPPVTAAGAVKSESRLTSSLFAMTADGGSGNGSRRASSSPLTTTHYRPMRRQSAVCQTTAGDSRVHLLTQRPSTTESRDGDDDNEVRLLRRGEQDEAALRAAGDGDVSVDVSGDVSVDVQVDEG